uniref:Monocarboxylate transporter 1-like n=2 Tax=Hirondellea gigas TaxID=1518452 RepID=A0A6A7G8J7_9CRUS
MPGNDEEELKLKELKSKDGCQDKDEKSMELKEKGSGEDKAGGQDPAELVVAIRKKSSSASHILPDVKDRGYAWVIIAVMFLSNVVTAGYIKSFGVTFNAISEAYPGTTAASGGLLMALLAGCRSLLAPAVGAAAVQFGYRCVMMFGVLLCSTALFSSYFCPTVAWLSLTLGAMMGVGMCSIETSQIVVLSEYFQNKKEIANSIRVSGNPLGGAALPFLLILLFEYYGLKLTYIILSALFLQLSVLIFLIRPYKIQQKIVQAKRIRAAKASMAFEEEMQQEIQPEELPKPEKVKKFDLKLFLNPLYWSHIFMMVGYAVALPQVQYFVPILGKSINLSPTQNSIILAYQAIFDSLCRLAIGYLLNKKLFKKTHCFIACALVGGLGICLIPLAGGFWGIMVTITIFSLGSSGFFATLIVILIDQFGRNNSASSFGFIRMTQGILNFVYPPILGLMIDVTGNFWLTFLSMGVGMAVGGLAIALQPCVIRAAKMDVKLL